MKKILVYLLSAIIAFAVLSIFSGNVWADVFSPGFIISLFFLTIIFSAALFFIIDVVKKNKKT